MLSKSYITLRRSTCQPTGVFCNGVPRMTAAVFNKVLIAVLIIVSRQAPTDVDDETDGPAAVGTGDTDLAENMGVTAPDKAGFVSMRTCPQALPQLGTCGSARASRDTRATRVGHRACAARTIQTKVVSRRFKPARYATIWCAVAHKNII